MRSCAVERAEPISWLHQVGFDLVAELMLRRATETSAGGSYFSGTPAGYFELDGQDGGELELAYFGLLPTLIGRGLGSELLATAIERAWQRETKRFWLHTCDLDHPRALHNYQSHGLKPYKTKEEIEQLPDIALEPWPGSSPSDP